MMAAKPGPATVAAGHPAARWAAVVAAVCLLVGLAVVDADVVGHEPRSWLPLALRVPAFALALVLLVVGLGGDPVRRAPGRGEVAAVAGLTVAAFAIRAWHLEALRVLIDEGNSIDSMFTAYRPDAPLLLAPNVYVTTMLQPAWQALVFWLAGPSLSAFRLSSAALGALTVPALWFLARALFDRRTALAAAIVLVGLAPHVHFSRVGLPHIADALFGTAALAGIACGLNGSRRGWALGGVALGLTHYGFEAGRWFFTPLVLVWLVVLWLLAPARLRGAGAGVGAFALGGALTLLPLYAAVVAAGRDPAPRLQSSALTVSQMAALFAAPRALGSRLWQTAGAYAFQPEQARFYGGDDALLTPLLVPFAALGVALSLWRLRRPEVLIPLWLTLAWLANVAMRDALVFARWVVVLPGLALATGYGAAAAARWLARGRERAAAPASIALAALLALLQVHGYFAAHIDRLAEQARADKADRDAVDAVLRAADLLPRGDVLLISEPLVDIHPPRQLAGLLRGGRDDLQVAIATPTAVDAAYLAALPDDRGHAFFVAPDDAATIARLAACFALDGPRATPYPVAADRRFDLYLARSGSRRAGCGS